MRVSPLLQDGPNQTHTAAPSVSYRNNKPYCSILHDRCMSDLRPVLCFLLQLFFNLQGLLLLGPMSFLYLSKLLEGTLHSLSPMTAGHFM